MVSPQVAQQGSAITADIFQKKTNSQEPDTQDELSCAKRDRPQLLHLF